jgi:hypothetical protein
MLEITRSGCKFVEIINHHLRSTGAPGRRAVFVGGENTQTNAFQEGSSEFKNTIQFT